MLEEYLIVAKLELVAFQENPMTNTLPALSTAMAEAMLPPAPGHGNG